jgi:Zn-dependent alcohol dehydrogenase
MQERMATEFCRPRRRTGERLSSRTSVPKIVDWYMDGRINIDDLITHVLPLERINDGFDLMHAGMSIRAVVTFP